MERAFSDVVPLAEWLFDEGLLDEVWVVALRVEARPAPERAGPRDWTIELLQQLPQDAPEGTRPGDHRWWHERTRDDVRPWTLVVEAGELQGPTSARGRVVDYGYGAEARRRLRLELENGDRLLMRGARWRVRVEPIRRDAPRLD